MNRLLAIIIIFTLVPALLPACQSASVDNAQNNQPVDGLSRDINQTQGSSVREGSSLGVPPVRPDYSSEREEIT